MIKVHFAYQDEPGRQPRDIGDAHFPESPAVGDVIVVGGVEGTVSARRWMPPRQGGGSQLIQAYELLVVLVPA